MSDFYNKYPYTDFHELNLDWVIERVKQLAEEWAQTSADWETEQEAFQDLKDYVINYFNNLDVQNEINHKLDIMAADGTLDALLLPYFNAYKSEINEIVYRQNNDINILKSRMDAFASLTDGSTTGDAELMDIRVGVDGTVYPSAGDAVRQQVLNIEHASDMEQIALTLNTGYVQASSGSIISNAEYNYSDIIQFKSGHLYYIHGIISSGGSLLSKYVSGNYEEDIIKGDGATYDHYFYASDDIYVRISSANSDNTTYNIDNILLYDISVNTVYDSNLSNIRQSLILHNGYVALNGNISTSSSYCYSDVITLKAGTLYLIHAITSENAVVLSKWSGITFTEALIIGDDKTQYHFFRPENDTDVRICSANSSHSDYDIETSEITVYRLSDPDEVIINRFSDPIIESNIINMPLHAGSYVTNTGTIASNSGYCYSDIIPLKAGTFYYFHAIGSAGCSILSDWTGGNYVKTMMLGDEETYDHVFYAASNMSIRVSSAKENSSFPIKKKEVVLYQLPTIISNMYDMDILKRYHKINVIGDSYVAGGNLNYRSTWHYMLANKYGITYTNYGINGNCLVDDSEPGRGVPVVDRYVNMSDDADLIIVIGGKNDYNVQIPLADFKTGLETLCAGLVNKYIGKQICFFTPWYVPQQTLIDIGDGHPIALVDYIAAIEEICNKYSIQVYNTKNSGIYTFNSTFRSTYFQSANDVSHLKAAGSKLFLPRAEAFIRSL